VDHVDRRWMRRQSTQAHEVKAVTRHRLAVRFNRRGWKATLVVDV